MSNLIFCILIVIILLLLSFYIILTLLYKEYNKATKNIIDFDDLINEE